MEACNTSHYWARELIAVGHDVRLMPAQYVKPYVKRGKNDAADAAAICEAVARPTMRFVAVKTPTQQSIMMHLQYRPAVVGKHIGSINLDLEPFREVLIFDQWLGPRRRSIRRIMARRTNTAALRA
jgi:hypothetical protein